MSYLSGCCAAVCFKEDMARKRETGQEVLQLSGESHRENLSQRGGWEYGREGVGTGLWSFNKHLREGSGWNPRDIWREKQALTL